MSVINRILDKKLAQTQEQFGPSNVTDEDIESLPVQKTTQDVPLDFEVVEKRPHTVVPKDMVPDSLRQVPELDQVITPIAQNLVEQWRKKAEIEKAVTAKRVELKREIEEYKKAHGYSDLIKDIEVKSDKLAEVVSDIDTQSDLVLAKFNNFFTALANQVKEDQQLLVTDKDKLNFVLGALKEVDANLSRSVTMKLRWFEKKNTQVVEKLKRMLRIWPIPEEKTKKSRVKELVAQIDSDINQDFQEAYDFGVSFLSDLYEIESKIEDITSQLSESNQEMPIAAIKKAVLDSVDSKKVVLSIYQKSQNDLHWNKDEEEMLKHYNVETVYGSDKVQYVLKNDGIPLRLFDTEDEAWRKAEELFQEDMLDIE